MKSCNLSTFACVVIAVLVSLSSSSAAFAVTINPGGSGTLGTVNFISGNLARGTHAAGGNLLGLSPVETAGNPTLLTLRPGNASIDGANDGLGIGSSIGPTGFHASGSPFWRIDFGSLPGQPNIPNHTFGIASLSIHSRPCCETQTNGTARLYDETDTTTLFMAANLGTISTSLAVTPVETLVITAFVAAGGSQSITTPYTSLAIGQSLEYVATSFMEFEADGLENLTLGSGDVLELDVTLIGNDFVNVEGIADLSGATIQLDIDPGADKGIISLIGASSIDLTGTQFVGLPEGFDFQIINVPEGQLLQVLNIPEPGSLLLCGLGLIGLSRIRRRRNRN